MLGCASSRISRSPVLVAGLLVIVMVSCIAIVEAQPAAHRSEVSARSDDNGLRRSQSHKRRHVPIPDERRHLCGKELRDELASICKGRGYNSPQGGMGGGLPSEGAATFCCERGCTKRFLDSYCVPLAVNVSDSSESTETLPDVRESRSGGVESTVESANQLRPQVQPEEPKSDDTVEPAETDNVITKKNKKHNFYVKTNNFHQLNVPVTRRQMTIR